jgi:hypothetical protein
MSTELREFRRVECWRDYEAVKMWGDANRHGKVSRALFNRASATPYITIPGQHQPPLDNLSVATKLIDPGKVPVDATVSIQFKFFHRNMIQGSTSRGSPHHM